MNKIQAEHEEVLEKTNQMVKRANLHLPGLGLSDGDSMDMFVDNYENVKGRDRTI